MFYNFHRPSARFAGALWVISLLLGSILSTASANQSVALEWDPSPDSDVIGYRLGYGTGPGEYTTKVDAGHATTATLEGLEDGRTYYIIVTAYNSAGLESLPSNEVTFTTDVPVIPSKVALTSPTSGSNLDGPVDLTLTADASFSAEIVARVEFHNGSGKVGEANTAPFRSVWKSAPAGDHTLRAVAIAQSGEVIESDPVHISIVPLKMKSIDIQANGSCSVTVRGAVGSEHTLWASDDLKTWTAVSTKTNVDGTSVLVDPDASTKRKRFYRVTSGDASLASN